MFSSLWRNRGPTTTASSNVIRVLGIVIAIGNERFWMQDPDPDAEDATSEGILIFVHAVPHRHG
jgi:predicted extracellular nuclease